MTSRRVALILMVLVVSLPALPAPVRAAEPITIPIPGLEIDGVPATITLPPGLDPATLESLGFGPDQLQRAEGLIVRWRSGKGSSKRRMKVVRAALGDPGVRWAHRLASSKADLYLIPPIGELSELPAQLQALVDAAAAFTTPPGADPATVTLEMRLAELRRKGIDWVELDRRVQSIEPNGWLSGGMRGWNMGPAPGINLAAAATRTRGANVRVAVIDTGILRHPGLAGRVLPGYDFIWNPLYSGDGDSGGDTTSGYYRNSRDPDPTDPGDSLRDPATGQPIPGFPEGCYRVAAAMNWRSSWHGTHVAGTIASPSSGGSYSVGVAPEALIVPIRVMGRCGGRESDIADAITWASGGRVTGAPVNRYPAKIINMSLGGPGPCSYGTQSAIDGALGRGASIVVSAGNDGPVDSRRNSPANCKGVIVVGALDPNGAIAPYSNVGPSVSVWAPGTDIYSTYNDGAQRAGAMNYALMSGTSQAAPHVAGTIALMFAAAKRALSPTEVRNAIASLRSCTVCNDSQAGKLDAGKLVALYPGASPTPTPRLTASPSGTVRPSSSATVPPRLPLDSWPPTLAPTASPAPTVAPSRPGGGAWVSPAGTRLALAGGSALALAPRSTSTYTVSWSPVTGATYFFLKGYYAPNPKGTYAQGARVTDCPADLSKYANTEWTGSQRTSGTTGNIGPLSSGSHCTIVRLRAYRDGYGTVTLGTSPIIFVGP